MIDLYLLQKIKNNKKTKENILFNQLNINNNLMKVQTTENNI